MHELLCRALGHVLADIKRIVGFLEGIPLVIPDAVDPFAASGLQTLIHLTLTGFFLGSQFLRLTVAEHGSMHIGKEIGHFNSSESCPPF